MTSVDEADGARIEHRFAEERVKVETKRDRCEPVCPGDLHLSPCD